MSLDTQLESDLITRLPREVRDGIYLELWRSCGLRQHIVWHDDQADRTKSHFCRWRCTTPFQVEDKLQEDIETSRIQLGVSLGDSFSDKTYASRLYSAWRNHWACGERVEDVHGGDGDILESTSRGPCWIRRGVVLESPSTRSPYLSMLLSCKIISSECLESIYESITFIFTDLVALNMFVGFCKVPPFLQKWPKLGIPPPTFRTYGEHLELSLNPVFPMLLPCSSPRITEIPEERHNSLDFHGLRLDLLENLTTLDIWIAARSTYFLIDQYGRNFDQSPYNLTKLNIEQLRMALSHLERVNNVTLSIPLAQSAGPEDGYIDDAALPSGLHIWRRGAGDRFHPSLHPIVKKKHLASSVYSSKERQVKLSYSPYVDEDWPPTQFSAIEGPAFEPNRGRIARLMESIRSKRKWLRRGR